MNADSHDTPTHDDIARQAHHLWEERGCPDGCDTDIWLEAERRMKASGREENSAKRNGGSEGASVSSRREAVATDLQKQSARAPQVPHHTAPKGKPAETGKPLWDKPHSN